MGPDMRINGRYLPMENDPRAEGFREGKLAGLREAQKIVKRDLDRNVDDLSQHMARYLMRLTARIKHEEEKG